MLGVKLTLLYQNKKILSLQFRSLEFTEEIFPD